MTILTKDNTAKKVGSEAVEIMPCPALGRMGAFTLLLAASLTIMVGSVISPALPTIGRHLGFDHSSSWLVTIPSLGVVVFGMLAGRFIDQVGAYRAMIVGLLLYGLTGIAAISLSFSQAAVIVDRLLLGGATAMVMSAGTALIAEFYEGYARLRMIAIQGMAIEIGGVIFLSLGGILGQHDWRLPFLLYLLSWLFLMFFFKTVPIVRATARQDALASTFHNKIWSPLIGAATSMTLFFVAIITLPFSLHLRFRLNESETGYFLAFISLMAVAAASIVPVVLRFLRSRSLLAVAFILYGCALLLLGLSQEFGLVILGGALMGCGFGFSIPVVNHMVVDESSAHMRGRNLSYLSMAIFLGQFISSFLNLISPDGAKILTMTGIASLLVACIWFFVHRLIWSRSGSESF